MLQNWKILNSAALESKAFANLLTYLRKGIRQGLVSSSLVLMPTLIYRVIILA